MTDSIRNKLEVTIDIPASRDRKVSLVFNRQDTNGLWEMKASTEFIEDFKMLIEREGNSIMTGFVTQEYDFYEAITKSLTCAECQSFEITRVDHIMDDKAIVDTTHGKFICESFEDEAATIYMRVTTVV
jgi:hypothetical protein